jgi:hypothetical protein
MYNPGYFGSSYQPEQAQPDHEAENTQLTWLDYLILSNPQGVMKVLNSYGYTGYLAPADEDEMIEACLDIMDKYGDQAVIDLLKSNPIYDVIAGISTEETKVSIPFFNATGDGTVFATIRTINYKALIEKALIIIGAFYLASKLFNFFTTKDA